jgi:hypothetical protein
VDAAGLGPEMFPPQAFVGMISDEIEQLPAIGKTDAEIAEMNTAGSDIQIDASEIIENHVSLEECHPADGR